MIKQEFKQGNHTIRIETAENLDDIKQNNFTEGQFHKYFIDGKQVQTYSDMINFIVQNNNNAIIPDKSNLQKLRKQMIEDNKNRSLQALNDLKEHYKKMNVSDNILSEIDNISKVVKNMSDVNINPAGVRINR